MIFSFFILFGLIFVAYLLYQYITDADRRRPKDAKAVPNAPGTAFHQLIQLLTRPPWNVMEEWLNDTGSIVRFSFLNTSFCMIGDADMAKDVFASKLSNYIKDQSSYHIFGDLLGTGLVTSEGKRWRRQRSLIAPPFKREMLQAVVPLSVAAARRVAAILDKARANKEAIDIAEEFRHMTLQVIGEAVLSMTREECDRTLPDLYLPVVQEVNIRTWYPIRKFLPLPATFKYRRCVQNLNNFVVDLIKTRIKAKHSDSNGKFKKLPELEGDILDRVIQGAYDVNDDLTEFEPIRQLRDEIKTFLLAGHETSSMMLTWALYELSKDTKSRDRVRKEALNAFSSDDGGSLDDLPSAEQLKQSLSFTECVLKETLRLHSVVPIVAREAVNDDVLCGYFIPKGTKLMIHLQSLHNNADLWPNPTKFDPTRFEGVDTQKPSGHRYAFNPFVNGPRSCIGQHFSLLESKIVLALLVRKYNISPALPMSQAGEKHPYVLPYAPKHGFPVHSVPV